MGRSKLNDPSIGPREGKKKENEAQNSKSGPQENEEIRINEEVSKKAKIGVTIKKSPNSDKTFESRLLDQDFDNLSIKNKILDIGVESEAESVVSDDGLVKKEEMKKSIFVKRKSNESSLSPRPIQTVPINQTIPIIPPPTLPSAPEEVKV